jgi:two-component system chemotaxis response regulator CheB
VQQTPISVLVVDDSALMRNLIGKMIENAPGLTLAGKAMNGQFALQKIPKLQPDVIVLDLEMPEMNGIEFLKERRSQGIDIPVVILSSIAKRGARITMEALSLGASDFILKPSGSISEDIHSVEKQLVETVRAYGLQYLHKKGRELTAPAERTARRQTGGTAEENKAKQREGVREQGEGPAEVIPPSRRPTYEPSESPVPRSEAGPVELAAIGISTGGPNALREVFKGLDPGLSVPVVLVQHMPAGFTTEFAKSLDRICPLEVKEAADGDLLKAGRILLCPGDYHMEVEKRRLAAVVRLNQGEAVNGHRPSVDVLFASVAKEYGGGALAVIMTGMGKDGAREIGSIHRKGGITIGQDETSSIVYGMPKVAAEMGHLQHIVSLQNMAETINRLVKENVRESA